MDPAGAARPRRGAPTFNEIIAAGTFGGRAVVAFVKGLLHFITGIVGVICIVPLKLLEQLVRIPFYEDRTWKQEPKRLLGTIFALLLLAGILVLATQRLPQVPWEDFLWPLLFLFFLLMRAWLDPGFAESYQRNYETLHRQEWFLRFGDLKGGKWVRYTVTVLFSLLAFAGLVYILISPRFSWMQVLYISAGFGILWGVAAFLLSFLVSGLIGLAFALFNLLRCAYIIGESVIHEGWMRGIAYLLHYPLCLMLSYLALPYAREFLELWPTLTESLKMTAIQLGIASVAIYVEGSLLRSGTRLWLVVPKMIAAGVAIYYVLLEANPLT